MKVIVFDNKILGLKEYTHVYEIRDYCNAIVLLKNLPGLAHDRIILEKPVKIVEINTEYEEPLEEIEPTDEEIQEMLENLPEWLKVE